MESQKTRMQHAILIGQSMIILTYYTYILSVRYHVAYVILTLFR